MLQMPPIRHSQRQRRAQADALDQPPVPGPVNAAAEPVVAATRLATATASVTARRRWEADIERRLDATEHLRREMREMKTLLQTLVSQPVVASTSQGAPVASTSQQGAPPVALPSRQSAAPIASSSVTPGLAPPPPWPTMDGLLGPADAPLPGIVDNIRVLPGDAPGRVASLVLPTLALHAHVSEKTRDRIWAGEFVDLYALLPESALDQPDYSLTIRPGGEGGNPAVCLMPKTKTSIRSFSQWSRAFQIYMSVLLVKPGNAMIAPQMLKYLHVIRKFQSEEETGVSMTSHLGR